MVAATSLTVSASAPIMTTVLLQQKMTRQIARRAGNRSKHATQLIAAPNRAVKL
jgi:hypothetical protein